MFTLYGEEAKENDCVICEHRTKSGATIFVPAMVKGKMAYAPYITQPNRYETKFKWVRKQIAIIKISRDTAIDFFKKFTMHDGKILNFDNEIKQNMTAIRVWDVPGSWDMHREI